jgi:hypothetical protein
VKSIKKISVEEDHGSKLAWANSSQDPISEKKSQEKGCPEWLSGRVPQYRRKKKKKMHRGRCPTS